MNEANLQDTNTRRSQETKIRESGWVQYNKESIHRTKHCVSVWFHKKTYNHNLECTLHV